MLKTLIFIVAFFILTGCATDTISDVPQIESAKIYKPRLEVVKSRKIAVEVVDKRSEPYHKKSAEVTQTVTTTLEEIFKEAGFTLDPKSAANLNVTIHEGDMPDQAKEDCVQLDGRLKTNHLKLDIEATTCSGVKGAYGGRVASEISRAYEAALNMLLKNMDKKLDEINQSTAHD